jgi:DNA invertase Pin-like site-specific DNA recombinase
MLGAGETLLVWKIDRLARSLKNLIVTAEELARKKIRLMSPTRNINTTTADGMLTFDVIAQLKRTSVRVRTTPGWLGAR